MGQSRSMTQANDFDGARRLGRRSLLCSIMAIAVGLSIILYLAITGKYTNTLTHESTPIPHLSPTYLCCSFFFCLPQRADVV